MSATDKIENGAQEMKGKEAKGKADQAGAKITQSGENVKDALKD